MSAVANAARAPIHRTSALRTSYFHVGRQKCSKAAFQLLKSNPPRFESWADDFLKTVSHPNTRRRYTSSVRNLKSQFKGRSIADISLDCVEEYKDARLASGIGPATVNRDLTVLRKMLRLAGRKRFIPPSRFVEVERLEEIEQRRAPHIVTFQEEEKILPIAPPHIRALMVLILETGMRSNREALVLKWENVDFANSTIQIRESKTRAGVRNVPLSARCKAELLRWRNQVGPEFSTWVFPNMQDSRKPLKDIRRSWARALKVAGIEYFWIYNLRHTFASRLSAAGASDLFVAQMMGHSSPAYCRHMQR